MTLNIGSNLFGGESVFKNSPGDGQVNIFEGSRRIPSDIESIKPFEYVVAADGTGDYLTIEEALTAAGSSAGTIRIKSGTYTITAGLTLATEQVLMGSGFGTKIYTTSNITMVTSTGHRAGLFNLRIQGNSTGAAQMGVDFSGNESTIKDCWIIDMGSYGVNISGSNCLISGCRIQDCINDCVHATSAFYIRISDNYIDNSNGDGIGITSSIGSTIIGNQITNHGDMGIRSVSSTQNCIAGNYIYSNGDNNTNGDGIYLAASHDNCVIGNVCHSNDGVGINIVATPTNKCVVVGNTVLNNEDGAITDGGTGSVIANNSIV